MQDFLKRGLFIVMLSSAWLAHAEVSAPSGSYSIDPTHGYINLGYNHMGFSRPTIRVTGFQADLTFDANKIENSQVNVTMEASSLDSGVEKFNGHLDGDKFFNVAKFPSITFASTSVKDNGDGTLAITGDLTIKGVTKPVTMDATLNKAGLNPVKKIAALGFSANATITRSEWGLGEYAPMVSDAVDISIEAEFFHNK
ncbi:MAG: YceI family protein [Pseudomonadales bacterium]